MAISWLDIAFVVMPHKLDLLESVGSSLNCMEYVHGLLLRLVPSAMEFLNTLLR